MFALSAGLAISNLLSLALTALVGFALGETAVSSVIFIGAMGGLFAGAVSSVAWRMANLMANDLRINALFYFAPALALGWLFAFGQVGDADVTYLIVGLVLTVASNAIASR